MTNNPPQKVMIVYRGRYHIREALDLETLAAVLRGAGHSVRFVYDPDCFGTTDNVFQCSPLARLLTRPNRVVKQVDRWQPDVILFQVLSNTYAWCLAVAESIKRQRAVPIVFMGLHPSLAPSQVMCHRSVDYVIAGEAESVIVDLLGAIAPRPDAPRPDARNPDARNHGAASSSIGEVGNLWYRVGEEPTFTRRAELVDLDALPLPDKELFRPYVSHRYSYCAMVSRGCPYRCSFCEETCSKQLYGGNYYRRKSVDTVMRELVEGKRRYHYREVIFKDSYLSGNQAWLADFIERYRREVHVPFKCFCTISGFSSETAGLLKEGGCYSIEFGLQTWNDRLRREVLDRKETTDDALEAFRCCRDARLRYDVDHMFNLPHETVEDHVLGATRYSQLEYLGRVKVHHLVYYPTAGIVEHAIQAGDLPANAAELLAVGHESDFYDQTTGSRDARRRVAGFAALYKILPILPRRIVRWFAAGERAQWLRWIPSPLMALLQGLNALRCRDLRFVAYLWIYPRKVFHSMWGSMTQSE